MEAHKLLNRIRQEQENFSAAQRAVAAYVVENYAQIPFLSITMLAQNIGVSENTIVKFCNNLGFQKFSELKNVFAGYVHSELSLSNKFSDGKLDGTLNDCFAQGLEDDISSIQLTLNNPANQENLPKLLKMIDEAQHIYITGGRSSAMLAGILVNILRFLNLKVHEVNFGVGDYLDRLSMVTQDDLLIVISLPRYTAQVINALKDLHARNIPIALITDTGLSPASPYATLSFYCNVKSSYFFPSMAGCLSLISVICRSAAVNRKQDSVQYLRSLERYLLDQGVFM